MTKYDIDNELITAIEKYAVPIVGDLQDYDDIISASEGKQFVLIGEATHGTQEFYRARAEITERLIIEKGFDAVAVEADWPDAYRVNRYVTLMGKSSNADEALSGFERFPTWMWRNREVVHFVQWLYEYNFEFRHPEKGKSNRWPVGFYGLDLYSLDTSINEVISYLDKVDPDAAKRARIRYGCLDHFMDSPQAYGYATELGIAKSCEKKIVAQLVDIRRKASEYVARDKFKSEDEFFYVNQNAELIKNAEQYYRAMFRGRPNSWNLRDGHMFETLENLADFLGKRLDREPRIVVWAHNSHVGNAGATEMAARGERNIGQFIRSAYRDKSLLIGFSTCRGYVTAADDWDKPEKRKKVNEPFPGSYEEVFHHVNHKAFHLDLRANNPAIDGLMKPRLQRAIGVVYRPETERHSHYLLSCLPEQFDFILHYDRTEAVEPLGTMMHPHYGELDETYPSGL